MPVNTMSDAYQITWLIRRLFRGMGQVANDRLAEKGITAADRAVMEFLYPDNELSVPEIAKRYSVSRQHVQVTVNGLLELKLLLGKKNPRHKRSPLMVLSKKGKNLFENILLDDFELIEQWCSVLSVNEQKRTRENLSILLDNLPKGDRDELRKN